MEEDKSKVCPKCGMQLVGKNNYCMGCGVNVDLNAGGGSSEKDGQFIKVYGNGTGYGGGMEYYERMLEAQKKREKKKRKNILAYGGMTTFLLVFLGVTLGIIVGLMFLKKSMEPKASEVIYHKDRKVTELAGVSRIDPPKAQEFEGNQQVGTIDQRKKTEESKGVLTGPTGANEESSKVAANPELQFFHGTMSFKAKGNAITEWEEKEVWDVRGLDANSVSYVVNHLNYQYEKYQNVIFIDCEITQTDEEVTLRILCRNMDIPENVITMVNHGLIEEELVVKSKGKSYVSLRRVMKSLENSGWKQEGQKSETVVIHVD